MTKEKELALYKIYVCNLATINLTGTTNEFQGQMTLNQTQCIQHLPITNENCGKGINIKQNFKLYLNIQGEKFIFPITVNTQLDMIPHSKNHSNIAFVTQISTTLDRIKQ